MGLASRIVNALRGTQDNIQRPKTGRIVQSEVMDRWRDYPADGLTPSRLATILRAADQGAADEALVLFEQMEEKDAHLFSVANTRRLALTGLKWKIVSAADVREGVDQAAADEVAAYCREVLAGLERYDEVLQHLSLAMGRNVAVVENVWDVMEGELRLVDMVPVPFERLSFDAMGGVRVLTKNDLFEGIELPPNKFVVHTPHSVSGHPMRGGLLRATALTYLGKHFALKDWLVFAEVFGMPVRIARYEPSATPEEKRELLSMLESLGSDASGIFSKAVELQFLEAGQGKAPPPYENICNFFNRELSKAWLGETLTVETLSGQGGSNSSAPRVHNEVRLDLRQDDIVREGRTIRRDILGPIARLQFGFNVPVPFFMRQMAPPKDLTKLANVLNVAVNDLHMKVPARWAHDALGLPLAGDGEATLTARSVE